MAKNGKKGVAGNRPPYRPQNAVLPPAFVAAQFKPGQVAKSTRKTEDEAAHRSNLGAAHVTRAEGPQEDAAAAEACA